MNCHTPPRWPAWGAALTLALALLGCASGPTPPPAALQVAADGGELPIRWLPIPRPAPLPPLAQGALLVPVRIEGIAQTLYMQFDVGHPATVLYAPKWASLAERLRRPDGAAAQVSGLRLDVGKLPVVATRMAVVERAVEPIRWEALDRGDAAPEIIGTVGADLIDGRVVLFDFPAGRIRLARDAGTLSLPPLDWQPFRFQGRRILLPAQVQGQEVSLMYDSGSSAFAWITHEAQWQAMARPGAPTESFPIRSWNAMLTAHSVATDATVRVGGVSLAIGTVTRIEGMGLLQDAGVRAFGLGGLAGNALFLQHRLVLDTQTQRFAVLPGGAAAPQTTTAP